MDEERGPHLFKIAVFAADYPSCAPYFESKALKKRAAAYDSPFL